MNDDEKDQRISELERKLKKQEMLVNIQWDIIACLMELKGVIEDE